MDEAHHKNMKRKVTFKTSPVTNVSRVLRLAVVYSCVRFLCCYFKMKRTYKSGAQKRSETKKKIAKSVENTKSLTSYFSSASSGHVEHGATSSDNTTTNEIDGETSDNNISDTEPPDKISDTETPDNISDTETPFDGQEDADSSNAGSSAGNLENHILLDFHSKFPTDRGILPGDINDCNLKRTIVQHSPCKPKSETNFINPEGKPNFRADFYRRTDGNITAPRQWLCYSPTLKRPYCDMCWLFAERNNHLNRSWIDGVAGDLKNMNGKIEKHEKSDQHKNGRMLLEHFIAGHVGKRLMLKLRIRGN